MTDRYANLRAALDAGPTPGPRRVSDDGLRVLDDTGGELMSRCPDGCSTLRTERGDQQRANVVLAAAAGPDTIRALLAERDRLREAAQMLADWAEHEVGAEPDLTPGLAEIRAALAQKQGGIDDNQD